MQTEVVQPKPTYFHFKKIIPESNEIFTRLQNEIPWTEVMWKTRKLPRLCCSNVELVSEIGQLMFIWVPIMIKQVLGIESKVVGIWGNNYRSGKDWLPPHHDTYHDAGKPLHVVSLSFGAIRLFQFKSNSFFKEFELESGDVFIFGHELNSIAKHSIPKQTLIKEARINLTCFVLFDQDPFLQTPKLDNIESPSETFARLLI